MAWNTPGKNEGSGKSSRNEAPRKPDAPPDLDEVLKNIKQKLNSLLGKSKKNPFASPAGNTPSSPSSSGLLLGPIITFVVIVFLLVWFFAGFFIVGPAEKAAILRFGKYTGTDDPGLHWVPPFICTRLIVNVQQVMTFPYQAEMLTQDENIVSVDMVVQYRIADLRNYLFNVASPTESLQQATASALRQVIGQTKLDDVLTSGREKVRQQTQSVLETTLARYHTGLIVTDVNMQPAKPPEEVTAAFDDAIKAREDEQRFKNQAIAYANRVVPQAEGNAARLLAEANAYKQQVVLNAQGAVAQFLALLPQYQQAPEVTRERMYLDTLQTVLGNSPKVIVDTPAGNNNMLYLPLQDLMKKTQSENSGKIDNQSMINTPANTTQGPGNATATQPAPTGAAPLPAGNNPVSYAYPDRPTYSSKQGE